jgi:plastocyanin
MKSDSTIRPRFTVVPRQVASARWREAKGRIRAILVVLALARLPGGAAGATITNNLVSASPWQQYALAVNAGDTVVWVNQHPADQGSNYVESCGGDWKSPMLNTGDSFAYAFTNAGFYAYRTGSGVAFYGTVTVNASRIASPSVTINTPVDGSILLSGVPGLVQASVANMQPLAEIEYFAGAAGGTNSIGTGTAAPYGIQWTNPVPGPCVLLARAVDESGRATWSNPVQVTFDDTFRLWGARVLRSGQFLTFFNCYGGGPRAGYADLLGSSDELSPSTGTNVAGLTSPGVFVDENASGMPGASRFYWLYHQLIK